LFRILAALLIFSEHSNAHAVRTDSERLHAIRDAPSREKCARGDNADADEQHDRAHATMNPRSRVTPLHFRSVGGEILRRPKTQREINQEKNSGVSEKRLSTFLS
jgi:hypothetical protein